MIAEMREQFFTLLVGIGFVQLPKNAPRGYGSRRGGRGGGRGGGGVDVASMPDARYNSNATNLQLISSVVAAGL